MTLMSILDEMLRLEGAMANLYRWLTGVLAADHPRAAAVFFRLCIQEEGHANLIRYHRRLARTVNGSNEIADDIAAELRQVTARIDELRARSESPTLAEAVEFAIGLEDSAAERIHAQLVSHRIGGSLVASLLDEDRRHRDVLQKLRPHRMDNAVA